MTNLTTINSTAPPPSVTGHPYTSPLAAVLGLVALITIPMISYTFFMAIRCPRNPFRRSTAAATAEVSCKVELASGVKYRNSAAESNDQCPVCLSVLGDGEEIRQLSACKHAFHAACVDQWLCSHSSCPVCRAAVPVKRSKRVSIDRADDFRQGLPDAASLI